MSVTPGGMFGCRMLVKRAIVERKLVEGNRELSTSKNKANPVIASVTFSKVCHYVTRNTASHVLAALAMPTSFTV